MTELPKWRQILAIQVSFYICLYITVAATIFLLTSSLEILIFDAIDGPWYFDSILRTLRLSLAVLIIFGPALFLVTLLKFRRFDKWHNILLCRSCAAIYYTTTVVSGLIVIFSVLISATKLVDNTMSVQMFCQTLAIVSVLLVMVLYLVIEKRYLWRSSRYQKIIGIVYVLSVSAVLSLGFILLEGPSEAKERYFDVNQVLDLQTLAWQIDDYTRVEGALPLSLEAMYLNPHAIPSAPSQRSQYRYIIADTTGLEYVLCATFSYESAGNMQRYTQIHAGRDGDVARWDYEAGDFCFELAVNKKYK